MMDEFDENFIIPESSNAGKASEASGEVPREAEHSERAETNNFQFLTFTDFQQTIDPQTKKKVRSHVMRRVHQTMRSGSRRHKEGLIVLDTSSLLGGPRQSQNPLLPFPNTLGPSRLNPFASYPIPMNVRTYHLFDHLQGPFCSVFKTMSKIGFFQTLTDPAGFRQILCSSACHMKKLRGAESEPSDAIVLHTQALQSVNSRLADPGESKSDGVLAAILAFCCHSIMFRDRKASVTHFNGLESIVRIRGGLQSLNPSPVLRMVLFWADTNIAFTEDRFPRFPIPLDLLAAYTVEPPADIPVAKLLIEACTTADISSAMSGLYGQNKLLVDQIQPRSGWTDGVFANLNLMPVLHKLLSIRYDHGQNPVLIKDEAYRAGAILYLASIRVKFGMNFSADIHLQNLKDALNAMEELNIDCDLPILLWLYVVGGTRSITTPLHVWFLSKLTQLVVFMDCEGWERMMQDVRGVLWADGLSQGECEVLRAEVSTKALGLYDHIFA